MKCAGPGLDGSESHVAGFDNENIHIVLCSKHFTQTITQYMTTCLLSIIFTSR